MKDNWFKKWGWIYRPTSAAGWALTAAAIFLIVKVFIVVDMHSHSGSDTLINTFPWAWIFLVTLGWVASKKSE